MKSLGTLWEFIVGEATVAEVVKSIASVPHPIDGANFIPSVGLWRSKLEACVRVEIAGLNASVAEMVAEQLRRDFGQQAVFVARNGEAWLREDENEVSI